MKIENKVLFGIVFLVVISSCSRSYTPRPHGYPRFEFPSKTYKSFQPEMGPYGFQIPTYSFMKKDQDNNTQPHWYNLIFDQFDATLHLTYRPFNHKDTLNSLIEESRVLAYKHTIKADEIEERSIHRDTSLNGIMYDLKGNTATPLNFWVTDNKQHFLRGAFYFNNHTERDSVMPVLNFVKVDIVKMLEDLQWNNY